MSSRVSVTIEDHSPMAHSIYRGNYKTIGSYKKPSNTWDNMEHRFSISVCVYASKRLQDKTLNLFFPPHRRDICSMLYR